MGVADSEWPKLITFSTNPSSPTEDAEYFNRIAAKRGGEQRVVELLQVIEPRLQDLKYLKLGSQPLVYADVGMEDLIPTTQLGQGFTRLLRLFSETLVAKSEIVLIDEIENGIHYSAMSKVWKGIAAIARQEDLQFFGTTHSYECIRSAHEAFSSEGSYDLALHRLERVKDEVRVVTYDKPTLETSFEMNLEVR
jgi:ABC-type branched-subunit amino acid transport system ATPase component